MTVLKDRRQRHEEVYVVFKIDAAGTTRVHSVRCQHSYAQPGFEVAIVGGNNLAHCLAKFEAVKRITGATLPEPVLCQCMSGR